MNAPRNPYAERVPPADISPYERIGMDALAASNSGRMPMPEPSGLHALDLQHIAERNWRAGYRARESEALVAEREHASALARAWDEGSSAGERHADERAGDHVEAMLRLIRARLAPPRKGNATAEEMQTRLNTVEQLVDGALAIFAENGNMSTVDDGDAAEASRFTVKGFFAQLEMVLVEAAEREGSHEYGMED